MGEVYRATDTKLKREVAIKVLPAPLASDPDRLARFQREAEVLASLNHPNIAGIYGIEQERPRPRRAEDGEIRGEASASVRGGGGAPAPVQEDDSLTALVMELVEGEDLSQRIARGAIPVDEALPIAMQIAEALEAAHERGIIHRDLKPANVKVRPDGTVKVLDFGLAKAMESTGAMSPSVSQSPTITTPAMTQAGMILGTAAYMSPEQAKGRTVDKRSDVWAFGAVLYEMLTGKRAFDGEDVSETLAGVMRVEPAWNALPDGLSPSLTTFIKRCLEKDSRQRLGDIHDMRLALDGAFDTAAQSPADRPVALVTRRSVWRRAVLLAGTAVVVTVAAWLTGRASVPAEPRPVIRSRHQVPEDRIVSPLGLQVVDIARGGQHFVYSGEGADGPGIYLRPRDDVDDRVIPTEGLPGMPFLSPDGQSLGYYDGYSQQLKRVNVNGGSPRALTDALGEPPAGARWETDGSIVYALSDGIWQVPENGGEPRRLMSTQGAEVVYGPSLLPGGEWILFTLRDVAATWDEADIVVASPATGERRIVVSGGHDARYLPTGHLVYARGDALYAVSFDAARLTTSGEAVPVVESVLSPPARFSSFAGPAFFALSANGTLVYRPGASVSQLGVMAWTGP